MTVIAQAGNAGKRRVSPVPTTRHGREGGKACGARATKRSRARRGARQEKRRSSHPGCRRSRGYCSGCGQADVFSNLSFSSRGRVGFELRESARPISASGLLSLTLMADGLARRAGYDCLVAASSRDLEQPSADARGPIFPRPSDIATAQDSSRNQYPGCDTGTTSDATGQAGRRILADGCLAQSPMNWSTPAEHLVCRGLGRASGRSARLGRSG